MPFQNNSLVHTKHTNRSKARTSDSNCKVSQAPLWSALEWAERFLLGSADAFGAASHFLQCREWCVRSNASLCFPKISHLLICCGAHTPLSHNSTQCVQTQGMHKIGLFGCDVFGYILLTACMGRTLPRGLGDLNFEF